MTPEQIAYVKNELIKGVAAETVQETLRQNGYSEQSIQEIFVAAASELATTTPAALTPKKESNVVKILLIILGVVGAIIVSLVILVSASLNSARDLANDASDKMSLNNMRSQAEIYHSTNDSSYEGFCESRQAVSLLSTVEQPGCVADVEQYRVSASLLTGEHYCVDSTGVTDVVLMQPAGLSCQ